MHCYGYIKGMEAETPSELEEVTIRVGPKTLRTMARFFLHVAEQMELHGEKFGHEHFEDYYYMQDVACRFIVTGK